jgi:hypothetical protein
VTVPSASERVRSFHSKWARRCMWGQGIKMRA